MNSPQAMTRLLAEMQTSILAAALPLMDGNVERFAVYVLVLRQSLRGADNGTPVLSLSSSLSLPFETTRRHVHALIGAGLCERVSGGIVATDRWRHDEEMLALSELSHDCFVRFVDDLQAIAPMALEGRATSVYDWTSGLQTAIDLMLAVGETNRNTHHDWLDLVLFSTVLCANYRTSDDGSVAAPPPAVRPIRVAELARALSLAGSTVQRRIARMIALQSLEGGRDGVIVSPAWLALSVARDTTSATHVNMRRILTTLEAKGFPFANPTQAYRQGRPPIVALRSHQA